jgi:hypothetical protein
MPIIIETSSFIRNILISLFAKYYYSKPIKKNDEWCMQHAKKGEMQTNSELESLK